MDCIKIIRLITLLFYVSRTEGLIRCFDCNFDLRNDLCDDRFNVVGVKVTNCTGSCTKVKMFNDGKGKVYGRYCTTSRQNEECRNIESGGNQRMEECYCNRDLCNAASTRTHGFSEVVAWIVAISIARLQCLLLSRNN